MGASMVKTAVGAMEPGGAEGVAEAAGDRPQEVVLDADFFALARRTRRAGQERDSGER